MDEGKAKGKAKGKAEGKAEGRAEGELLGKLKSVPGFLALGLSVKQICWGFRIGCRVCTECRG